MKDINTRFSITICIFLQLNYTAVFAFFQKFYKEHKRLLYKVKIKKRDRETNLLKKGQFRKSA